MWRNTTCQVIAVVAVLLIGERSAQAQCSIEPVQKLLATGGVPPGGSFGFDLDIWGDTLIVGASTDDEIAQNSGAAYIFNRTPAGTFVQTQKLFPLDGEAGCNFGHEVAIWGDTIVIGARGDNDFVGSAYVYRRNASGTWLQHQKLEPVDNGELLEYGYAVDIFDRTIIIGARASGYVYRRLPSGTWVLEDILVASDDGSGGTLGARVAAGLDNILITAAGHNNINGMLAGAVYAFRRRPNGKWQETQVIIAPDGHDVQNFGYDVAIEGNHSFITAGYDSEVLQGAGAAYYLRRTPVGQWVFEQKIRAFDAAVDDFFGFRVAMSGDLAVVGAHGDDDMGEWAGAAYLFRRTSSNHWIAGEKLLAPDGDEFDVSSSVLVQGMQVIIGAGADENDGTYVGSAWVFDVDCDPIADVNGDGVVNIGDLLAVLNAWGPCGAPCPADVNHDGVVNIHDLLAVIMAL